VTICAGLAYDCFGRELLLTADIEVATPANTTTEEMTLLIFVVEDGCGGAARQVDFVWQPTREVKVRHGVPLACWRGGSVTPRHYRAHPLARPHIASGRTLPEDWLVVEAPVRDVLSLQVTVDFTAAGFTGIPGCFVWLHGPRLDPAPQRADVNLILVADHIEALSTHGFTYVMYAVSAAGAGALRRFAADQKLTLGWLAVEPRLGGRLRRFTRGAGNEHA